MKTGFHLYLAYYVAHPLVCDLFAFKTDLSISIHIAFGLKTIWCYTNFCEIVTITIFKSILPCTYIHRRKKKIMGLLIIFCSLVIASVIGQQPPILPQSLRIGESFSTFMYLFLDCQN